VIFGGTPHFGELFPLKPGKDLGFNNSHPPEKLFNLTPGIIWAPLRPQIPKGLYNPLKVLDKALNPNWPLNPILFNSLKDP